MAMVQSSVAADLELTPGIWTIDANHSAIVFSIRHLGLSKVRGRFSRFSSSMNVSPDQGNVGVEAEIDLSSIDTNNSDRDAHLRSTDFFNTDAEPTMRFSGNGLSGSGEDWTLTGTVTPTNHCRVSLPAAAAAIAMSWCKLFGTQISIASISLRSTTLRQSDSIDA